MPLFWLSKSDIDKMEAKRDVQGLINVFKGRKAILTDLAVAALAKIGDEHTVDKLIAALKDQNEHVRSGAVAALGEIGDARAVDGLVAALKDSSVRWAAAMSLGEIGDARAVDGLVVALKDQNGYVRMFAAGWLGGMDDARAVDELFALIKDQDANVRSRAAGALGKIGGARAVDELTVALKDPMPNVSSWAAAALREIGDKRAVEAPAHTMVFGFGKPNARENAKIVYGPCTQIRRFKADQEEQYRNHLKFVKAFVVAAQVIAPTAQVRLYALNAYTLGEEFPFMIVITGEREAFMQMVYTQGVLAEKENEIIMKEFGGNFRAITPHSSVGDAPGPGTHITSLQPLENTKQTIALGRYSVAII